MQGVADILYRGKLDVAIDLTSLDIVAFLFSALIHDYKHPGLNNGFLINSKSEIARIYNGKQFILII